MPEATDDQLSPKEITLNISFNYQVIANRTKLTYAWKPAFHHWRPFLGQSSFSINKMEGRSAPISKKSINDLRSAHPGKTRVLPRRNCPGLWMEKDILRLWWTRKLIVVHKSMPKGCKLSRVLAFHGVVYLFIPLTHIF